MLVFRAENRTYPALTQPLEWGWGKGFLNQLLQDLLFTHWLHQWQLLGDTTCKLYGNHDRLLAAWSRKEGSGEPQQEGRLLNKAGTIVLAALAWLTGRGSRGFFTTSLKTVKRFMQTSPGQPKGTKAMEISMGSLLDSWAQFDRTENTGGSWEKMRATLPHSGSALAQTLHNVGSGASLLKLQPQTPTSPTAIEAKTSLCLDFL